MLQAFGLFCCRDHRVLSLIVIGKEDPESEDSQDIKATSVAESEGEAQGPDDLVDMLSSDSQAKVVDKATRSKRQKRSKTFAHKHGRRRVTKFFKILRPPPPKPLALWPPLTTELTRGEVS